MFPVIFHDAIYFLSSAEAKEMFIKDPKKYLMQPVPESYVPVRLAVVGPPKSGKTTGILMVDFWLIPMYCIYCDLGIVLEHIS